MRNKHAHPRGTAPRVECALKNSSEQLSVKTLHASPQSSTVYLPSLPLVNPLCLRNYQDAHRGKSAADRIVYTIDIQCFLTQTRITRQPLARNPDHGEREPTLTAISLKEVVAAIREYNRRFKLEGCT
jgi:hypothetical protein